MPSAEEPGLPLSIITICLNESQRIAQTVQSVTQQSMRDQVEFIVIDGGSTDGTLDILQGYRSQLDVLISEPDEGIYQAMNKGANHARGDYLLFLNGGDYLAQEDSLDPFFASTPQADILYGYLQTTEGKILKDLRGVELRDYLRTRTLPHQATFIRRELFECLGGYDESFRIAGDYDFFVRAILDAKASAAYFPHLVSVFNLDGIALRESTLCETEKARIQAKMGRDPAAPTWQRFWRRVRRGLERLGGGR